MVWRTLFCSTYRQRRRLRLTLLAAGSAWIPKRTPQELSVPRAIIVILLHPIHQTIIIITECHAIASRYDFLTLDGVSLHPSFRFDIAAIHGRNGELHVSVGVGRVLATLELVVWHDDAIMYVLCDRGLDRLLGNDQKCFGSFRGGSMVGILVLGIQVPGSGNIKHQTVDRHSMSRSSLDPRGFRFVGTGRLLSILSAAFALRFGQSSTGALSCCFALAWRPGR